MKIKFLVVGKTTDRHIDTLVKQYIDRIAHYLPIEWVVQNELRDTKNLTTDEQKQREGQEILRRIAVQDRVILFDEHGAEHTSRQLASWLQNQMNTSTKNLWLIIGGPYGFSDDVYRRANGALSLSRLTFSHQMVRLIAAEQIYRALTIINNEPYHHD